MSAFEGGRIWAWNEPVARNGCSSQCTDSSSKCDPNFPRRRSITRAQISRSRPTSPGDEMKILSRGRVIMAPPFPTTCR